MLPISRFYTLLSKILHANTSFGMTFSWVLKNYYLNFTCFLNVKTIEVKSSEFLDLD